MMMSTEIEILKDVTIFQDLSSDELEILAPVIRRVKVQEGEMLTQRGMAATTLYVNLSGNAMVSYSGDRALTLHEKGDVVGVSVGVVPSVYKGTALALTDGEWLAISGQDLLDLVQGNNSLGEKILKKLSAISTVREPVSNGA
jgi:CRP-like cAMP-binding protein